MALINPSENGADLSEQVHHAVRRLVLGLQKLPAGRFKRDLDGKIDSVLLRDIEGRIAWRNVLAHRYLRERLRRDDRHMFKPGTLDELTRLTSDFEDLSKRVGAEAERLRNELSAKRSEAPEAVHAIFDRMALEVFQGTSYEPGD